mgnify:CR=1 FL=1
MSLMSWLQAKKSTTSGKGGPFTRARNKFSQTTLPLISPRRGRRILRREQLFSVVRESMIRGGVLSSSYEFKVLTLDANGDSFLVLIDLALPAEVMPDEYLLEIERWIQGSARSRHSMQVQAVYWRRQPVHDLRGVALKASVAAQTRRDAPASAPAPLASDTAIPRPPMPSASGRDSRQYQAQARNMPTAIQAPWFTSAVGTGITHIAAVTDHTMAGTHSRWMNWLVGLTWSPE